MAKNVFNEIGATYKVIELDEHNDGRRLQEALAQMTGARTVKALCCILGGVGIWSNFAACYFSIYLKKNQNMHIWQLVCSGNSALKLNLDD